MSPSDAPTAAASAAAMPRTKSIGHYVLGKTIGEGTFGKVKLGTHILTGERVAVKVLEKERIVEVADVERVAREVHILKLLRHPHIVQLYEIIETRRQLYLIMEYASGGELFDFIVARGRVAEKEACRFFHQIIAGIEKIHAMNIVHRDLKPENLLIDAGNCIKIVDFGLSNVFQDGQLLKTACGSPCYAAPEMIAGHSYVPSLCDLWSCGVILFALVCGYLPFEDQNTSALYRKILSGDYHLPSFLSLECRDLISGLLTVDPNQRLTVPLVRQTAWYRQLVESSVPDNDFAPCKNNFEEDILRELDNFGLPLDYATRCLQLNKHNHVTTTYYLLAEKKRRMADQLDWLGADGYRATSMEPKGRSSKIDTNDTRAEEMLTPRAFGNVLPDASPRAEPSSSRAMGPAVIAPAGPPSPLPSPRPSSVGHRTAGYDVSAQHGSGPPTPGYPGQGPEPPRAPQHIPPMVPNYGVQHTAVPDTPRRRSPGPTSGRYNGVVATPVSDRLFGRGVESTAVSATPPRPNIYARPHPGTPGTPRVAGRESTYGAVCGGSSTARATYGVRPGTRDQQRPLNDAGFRRRGPGVLPETPQSARARYCGGGGGGGAGVRLSPPATPRTSLQGTPLSARGARPGTSPWHACSVTPSGGPSGPTGASTAAPVALREAGRCANQPVAAWGAWTPRVGRSTRVATPVR